MTTLTIHLEIGHNASIRDKTTSEGFTHDWDVFVRGANGADIRHYVDRVVFHLHETFEKPKRVAKEPPYSVSTSGYAGFNLPIQIYLKNNQEPRKIHFNYDLQLQPSGPPIHKVQKEKYTFHGVSEDFRSRLLKGGAILGSSGANLENSSAPLGKIEEKSQMTSKPRFSGASEQPKKYKTKLDEPKSDQFTNLFGTPITKTSRTAEVPKSKEVSKPLAKSSTSNSTNNSGKGDKLSLDKDKTKKSPYKDKDRDKEKPKDNKDRQPTENNSKKDEKKDKRDKKEYGRKDKKERDKDKSPQLRPKSASPKRAKSPSPKSNSNKEREKDREKDKKSKKHSKDKEMKHREKESSKDKDKDYKTKDNKNSKEKENSGNSVSNNISVKEAEKTEKSKEKAKEEPKEKIDNEKTKHKHKKKDKEHKKEKKERDDKVHKREEKKQESYNNKNSSSQKSVSTKERDKTDNLFGTSPKSEPSASPPPRADLEPEKPIPMLIDDSSNTSKLSSRESSPSSPPRSPSPVPKKPTTPPEDSQLNKKSKDKKDKREKRKEKKGERDEKRRKRKLDADTEVNAPEPPNKMDRKDQESNNHHHSDDESKVSSTEDAKPLASSYEGDAYMTVLRDLQTKIMGLKEHSDLQKVVQLIAETGRYEVSAHTFDFDLCLLDRSTVMQLQAFLASLN